MRTFFRHCPSCGRRFEIRLGGKNLIKEDRKTARVAPSKSIEWSELIEPLTVRAGKPITVDVDSFRYAYRCKHCGHEWSEVHKQEHAEH
jgi:DNA-directed RNA polymerase subunit RPC12/RpoP